MSECKSDCSKCGDDCPSKKDPKEFLKPLNEHSRVGKVIAVVSGKGGVGKSMVTSMLAVLMRRRGYKVGVLDADVTGPSIPQAFGIHGNTYQSEFGIEPADSAEGVKVMSINLLLDSETSPVLWRGPVIAGAITQFWTDVHWGEVDYMFVDMPPGTGDVPLTVFQSLPVDGVVVVATPQELVGMIVAKAIKMARMMSKQVVGLVENMSFLSFSDKRAACVILASGGYPKAYKKGCPITIGDVGDAVVYHAGTKLTEDGLVTSGGRVMGVTAVGETLRQALDRAYAAADNISFENMYKRSDIGARALKAAE